MAGRYRQWVQLPRSSAAYEDWSRARGSKDSQISRDAVDGTYDEETWAFVRELNEARARKGKALTSSEIFQVVLNLGYRRVADGSTV